MWMSQSHMCVAYNTANQHTHRTSNSKSEQFFSNFSDAAAAAAAAAAALQQPPHPPPALAAIAQKSSPRCPPTCSISHAQRIAQLKMSGRSSGGAVKRQREEEGDGPALAQVMAHAEPLMLLVLVKAHFDVLVWLQLCNPQGDTLFSFVHIPPRVPRPFAGAPVYDMSLTHAERLCAVGCGFKGKLVRLLSLGVGRHFEPQRNRRACHQMMQSNARRVASKPMAAVRDEAAKEAEELCASGQCAAALVPLQRAIDLGDYPSCALNAWLLIDGREGVAKDWNKAFKLVEKGDRLGCHHCQGVLAYCYRYGFGCKRDEARSLELARESSGRGSRYGQVTLGSLHDFGAGGLAVDRAQALALYRLAAAQGLDEAQRRLGYMYYSGYGVAQDFAEALRWYLLAAAQRHPTALYKVAVFHECGLGGVAVDVAEAIRWYRRAQAAGNTDAADKLQRLRA